ncbi:hypothetical protein RchiOBHm_Chr2g0173451 [Rosa chinensis]|uniref:Uncharacterized protein n=1 Tax=Rosa chinensis TaxID=74649 RepID=A0A2P6S5W1_ROSCH|nr:uncharacterized protein LOC112186573 [Rosa chinensis]PRQ54067.1 hypothetical protein RchiOBHm_Chr2g0173451 [Rosa chinensis]
MTTSGAAKLPRYQRLRQHDDDEGYYDFEKERVVVTKAKSSSSIISWYKLKSRLVPSVSLRRRFRLRRRVVSLRRLLRLRRKIKLACSHLRVSCQKVVKRLKDGQSQFGDLFAGNYMFLQVSPSSLKCLDHRRRNLAGAGGEQKQHHHHHLQFQNFPSRTTGMGYTFPRN